MRSHHCHYLLVSVRNIFIFWTAGAGMRESTIPNVECEVIKGRANKERWVLFGICVANKPANKTAEKLDGFLDWYRFSNETPFQIVAHNIDCSGFMATLRLFKFGQYTRIERAFREVTKLDVEKDLSVERLESIPGIGPKTARMLMLYIDPDLKVVPLDTHVLKYLRLMNVSGVPKSTPPKGKTYKRLEDIFIAEAVAQGKSVRQLDTEVWQAYSSGDLSKLPQPMRLIN